MDKPYVIGVDGGGTKTDCVLVDRSGHFIDCLQAGPSSHEFLGGFDKAESRLLEMTDELLERNRIRPEQVAHATFGLAGLDSLYQKERMANIVKKTRIVSTSAVHDGSLGIKAGTSEGWGVAIINGTGCSLIGLDRDGVFLQYGGQTLVMDDIAGGYVIGRRVVQLVFEDLVLKGAPTLLTQMTLDKLESGPADFMETLMWRVGEGQLEVKELAPLMFEAARENDELSCEYLKSTGKRIGRYLDALVRTLEPVSTIPVEVVLIGSAFLHAADPTLTSALFETAADCLGEGRIQWRPLKVRPVCGAAIDALEKANEIFEPDGGREKYLETLNAEISRSETVQQISEDVT